MRFFAPRAFYKGGSPRKCCASRRAKREGFLHPTFSTNHKESPRKCCASRCAKRVGFLHPTLSINHRGSPRKFCTSRRARRYVFFCNQRCLQIIGGFLGSCAPADAQNVCVCLQPTLSTNRSGSPRKLCSSRRAKRAGFLHPTLSTNRRGSPRKFCISRCAKRVGFFAPNAFYKS